MPDRMPVCQPYPGVSSPKSTSNLPAAQHIDHTASRRTGPRRWLRAVEWTVGAGHHPHANSTTLEVARDLAARMDYDTGHVRYGLDAMLARTGLSRSCVTNHVRYLRETGLIAWAEGGSRTNSHRPAGLPGYAGTATVYAAVIPAAYDHAMGHHIHGTGYQARIVVDYRTMPEPVDNPSGSPVGNSASGSSWTPSLNVVKESGSAEVVDGFKDTSRARAAQPHPSPSLPQRKPSSQAAGNDKDASNRKGADRRSPMQVARDYRLAGQVRPLVPWTQTEGIRRLGNALRPLIDRGLGAQDIAIELNSWWLDWRPAKPAAYIRAQLAKQAQLEAEQAAAVAPMDNADWRAMCEAKERENAVWEQMLAVAKAAPRTDAQRREAVAAGRYDLQRVADHLEDHGPDDAIDLYGVDLVIRADKLTRSARFRIGA